MKDTPKRFDDWEKVDCNSCGNYWTDSCDGAPKGSNKVCNSFLPTRSIVIPEKVKQLEWRVRWLGWVTAIGFISIVIAILMRWI
jgi:hypothetical protein